MKKDKIVKPPKSVIWNTNKDGGWKTFYDMTNDNKVLDGVTTSEHLKGNPEKIMNEIESEMINIKFRSFGKVKYRDKSFVSTRLVKLQEEKINCDDTDRLKDIDSENCKRARKRQKRITSKGY